MTLIACWHHGNNTSITLSEFGHYYSMKAHFSKSKTKHLEEYMDEMIGTTGNTSFVNTNIDGQIALDDHTVFYIKKYPGFIRIKLDKDENSDEAYYRIKSMCEGIKEVLAK